MRMSIFQASPIYWILICVRFASVLANLDCTFEHGFCSWRQVHGDQFDWNINSGHTFDRTSGPQSDHTTGGGDYAVIYGRDAHDPAWVAQIRTPDLFVWPNTTLSFFYYMNGPHIGNLSLIQVSRYNVRKTLWSKQGRQGPEWKQAVGKLDEDTKYLMFEASADHHYGSDLAIDDISTNVKPLEISTFAPSTTPTTSTTPPPTSDPNHITLDCDFERDLCAWSQDSSDDFDWHLWNGETPDFTSGPTADHKNGAGSYMLVKGHDAHNNTWSARFTSPPVVFQQAINMTFWFHMNGLGIGKLSVLKETSSGNVQTLWTRSGRQGSEWKSAQITLPAGSYRIIFEADTKFHYGSDLAVDDIHTSAPPLIG